MIERNVQHEYPPFLDIWRLIMWNAIKQFARDEEGATAIEYGLIAALIAVAIIVSLQGVRDALVAIFDSVAAALTPSA